MNIDTLRIRLPLTTFCQISDDRVYAGMLYNKITNCTDLQDTYVKLSKSMWPYEDNTRIPFKDGNGAELGNCALHFTDGSVQISLIPNLNIEQLKLFRQMIDKGTDIFAVLSNVIIEPTNEKDYPEIKEAVFDHCYINFPTLEGINKIISNRKEALKTGNSCMDNLTRIAAEGKHDEK